MKWILWIFLITHFCLGCNRPNPIPEQSDPIYLDLTRELEAAESRLEAAIKALEEAKIAVEAAKPRTLDKTIAREDLKKATEGLKYAEQEVEFLKIRRERRKVEGRVAYRRAFAAGETWPSPAEYENYKVNKRLLSAPRTWSKRLKAIQEAKEFEKSRSTASAEH